MIRSLLSTTTPLPEHSVTRSFAELGKLAAMTAPRFQLLNDAMSWMTKCFGRSLTLQEMMVGLCIWRVAHHNEPSFTGQQITTELDIPYSTATRFLRRWIERGVIEIAPEHPEDARLTQYQLTDKGIRMRDILARWDKP